MKYRSNVAYLPGVPPPTYTDLLNHARNLGLCQKPGYRGARVEYGSYKLLAGDALVEVAFDVLGEQSYVNLIEALGYSHWADKARADWKEHRGEDA